eukprot:scaffold112341_cov24-Tisochrysis_lutea.AAC.1
MGEHMPRDRRVALCVTLSSAVQHYTLLFTCTLYYSSAVYQCRFLKIDVQRYMDGGAREQGSKGGAVWEAEACGCNDEEHLESAMPDVLCCEQEVSAVLVPLVRGLGQGSSTEGSAQC